MPTYKIVGVFLTMGLFGLIGKVKALEVGSPAPDITALDENCAEFRFVDAYAKGPALVFFYPKADTPVARRRLVHCATRSRAFRPKICKSSA